MDAPIRRPLRPDEAADLLPGRLLLFVGATMPDGSVIVRDVEFVFAVTDRLLVVRGARDEVEFYAKPEQLLVVERRDELVTTGVEIAR